jgi:hypothetical protein
VATLVSETWVKYDQLSLAHRRFSAPLARRKTPTRRSECVGKGAASLVVVLGHSIHTAADGSG